MNWAASLSSAGAVRPPYEMLGAMLIIRSSASSVTWSLLHHATDHGLVYHFVDRRLGTTLSLAPCLLRHLRGVSERPIKLEQVQVGRVSRYDHSVLPLMVVRSFFGPGVG
jgi:hypothetical protein